MTILEQAGFYNITATPEDADIAKLRLLLTKAAMRLYKLGERQMADELDDFRLGVSQ